MRGEKKTPPARGGGDGRTPRKAADHRLTFAMIEEVRP
jgi:hypothetical protein